MPRISKNDSIFIAGSTGLVGRSITKILKKHGYGLKENNGEILTPTRKELDLTNTVQVKNWMKKNNPNIVIVAAAKVGGIYANATYPADFLLENMKIQNNLIEASWSLGVKRFLFLGSSCIYPKYSSQPIKEDELLTGQLEITNEWYAIAKISGIKLCQALRTQYGFDAISLMPTNLYGPHDNFHPLNSHVMAALIRKFREAKYKNISKVTCWGTGSALREFLYVDDLAEAIVFCLENWDPSMKDAPMDKNGDPLNYLNIGTGKDISIKDLALKIANIVGFKGDILWDKSKPDGTPRKVLDISKISKMGWAPLVDLDEGIKKTISFLDNL